MRDSTSRVLLLAFAIACDGDDLIAVTDPHQPFADGDTTLIGADPAKPVASGPLSDEGCLQVTADACVPVVREGKYCTAGAGPVDAVVVGGQIVEVVCYEDTDAASGPTVVVDGDGDGELDVPQQDNGAVVTFDPATNGVPIDGNLTVDANKVSIYGNGPDKTILDGDLHVTGNNARVRGIRVRGNVTVDLNTAALVFLVVDGNLTIESNGVLVAETTVYGNLELKGNNGILVNDRVAGNWKIEGQNPICDGNHAITDPDGDKTIDEGELGAALSCPKSS